MNPLTFFMVLVFCIFFIIPAWAGEAEKDVKNTAAEKDKDKKDKKVKLGYELEFEYVWAESDPKAAPYFQFDKFVLDGRFKLDEHIFFYGEIDVEPDEAEIKCAYGELCGLCAKGWVKMGIVKNLIKPKRRTESYPLIGTAFWRGRTPGLQMGCTLDLGNAHGLSLLFEFSDGYTLEPREPGEKDQFQLLADRCVDVSEAGSLGETRQIGLALRYDFKPAKKTEISLGAFCFLDKLTILDARNLLDVTMYDADLGNPVAGDAKWRRGAFLKMRLKAFRLQGMYIHSRDSSLFREGWYVSPSYTFNIDRKYLRGFEVLMRAGGLVPRMDPTPLKSETWDRNELTAAVHFKIVKNLRIKCEMTWLTEEPGLGIESVANNEFVCQFEYNF